MQNQLREVTPLPFDQAPTLSRELFDKAELDAKQKIINLIPKPNLKEEMAQTEPEYPGWATIGMFVLLGVIAIGCFIISAGKQLTAAHMVLDDFKKVAAGQVGDGWVLAGLISFLGVSEIGALAFSFGASMYGKGVLRWIAVVCAGLAVIANVVMTIMHPLESTDVTARAFQWIETLLFPSLVLAVGYAGELALLKYFELRKEAVAKLNAKREQWDKNTKNPEKHEDYLTFFHQNIIDGLRNVCSIPRRRAFNLAIETVYGYDTKLVEREYQRHRKIISVQSDLESGRAVEARPTEPPKWGLAKIQEQRSPFSETSPSESEPSTKTSEQDAAG